MCTENSASFCRCHWKDWSCFPKYTVEKNKHVNIIMAVYEIYSKGNFFSLYSQQTGSVSSFFFSPLRLSFAGIFQNVPFFGPKGILNQAKMTPGFTASSSPPHPALPLSPPSSSYPCLLFLFLDNAEFILRKNYVWYWDFCGFSYSIHFLSVKEVLASFLASIYIWARCR